MTRPVRQAALALAALAITLATSGCFFYDGPGYHRRPPPPAYAPPAPPPPPPGYYRPAPDPYRPPGY